jgi:hypothetical protein
VQAKIVKGQLVITLPLQTPAPSASGTTPIEEAYLGNLGENRRIDRKLRRRRQKGLFLRSARPTGFKNKCGKMWHLMEPLDEGVLAAVPVEKREV